MKFYNHGHYQVPNKDNRPHRNAHRKSNLSLD